MFLVRRSEYLYVCIALTCCMLSRRRYMTMTMVTSESRLAQKPLDAAWLLFCAVASWACTHRQATTR